MRMWTRPADRAPPYGPCGQAMEKLTLPHRLPTLGALAPTFSPLLQQRFMTKATAPAPAGSRIAPSSQAIRLRNTPANSRGDPTSESEKQHLPAQFSVWRRSDIRQALGATRGPESPEVKASGGRGDVEPFRSGQPGEASEQEGRSESERTSRRKLSPHEADSSGSLEPPRVCPCYPMASADTEELRRTYRGSRRRLKAAILESTAVKVRKVWGAGRMTLECRRPCL